MKTCDIAYERLRDRFNASDYERQRARLNASLGDLAAETYSDVVAAVHAQRQVSDSVGEVYLRWSKPRLELELEED